jgi:predicted kinase
VSSVKGNLLLLRGLPGSGKTTLAKAIQLASGCPIISIDDYFTDPVTGRYFFKYQENHLAYKHCETRTRQALEQGYLLVVLHHTFTLDWEMEPYFKMASDMDYSIHAVTVENYHGGQNVHDIPEEHIRKMADKYRVKLL